MSVVVSRGFCRFKLALPSLLLLAKDEIKTPVSTVVHAAVVCGPKILPIAFFLSHTLRSKIIAPWNMSQYQKPPRISLKTSVFYLHFQVRFSLAMLWTSRLDTAVEETWVGGQFSHSCSPSSVLKAVRVFIVSSCCSCCFYSVVTTPVYGTVHCWIPLNNVTCPSWSWPV